MTPALGDTWSGSILANRGRIHRAASAAWIIRAVSTDAEWFEVCAESADIVIELAASELCKLIDAASTALPAAEVMADARAILVTPYVFAATDADAAAMAPARGPPTHGVGNPCERPPRECEICQTTTRKAGPNMAFKCKEAPRRFLARGSLLSIFCQDPRYGAQPPVSVYSVAAPCATRTCAAGSKAGRDVDFLD
jgi:hypothetical protein